MCFLFFFNNNDLQITAMFSDLTDSLGGPSHGFGPLAWWKSNGQYRSALKTDSIASGTLDISSTWEAVVSADFSARPTRLKLQKCKKKKKKITSLRYPLHFILFIIRVFFFFWYMFLFSLSVKSIFFSSGRRVLAYKTHSVLSL